MKSIFSLLIILSAIFLSLPVQANDNKIDQNQIEQINSLIKNFQMSLKQELMKAIKEGGPENAISICNEKAPLIASELSRHHNVSLRRTALGFRNPDNAPDAWEKETLHSFMKQKEEGIAVEDMIAHREENGMSRYMKAIPMQPICAMCHGEKIDKNLHAKIKSLYPNDTAINYKLDDIRGAFTIKIPAAAPATN